jgi:hypothetical protein
MSSNNVELVELLEQRKALESKINQFKESTVIAGLSPLQIVFISAIFGLFERNNRPPTIEDIMPLVSPGTKPRSFYYHLPVLRKKGLIKLKVTGVSPALIYPTQKACGLFNVPYTYNPAALNPTHEKALRFIKDHVAKTGHFPSHEEINRSLGRTYKAAGDILYALEKNKFIRRESDKWALVSHYYSTCCTAISLIAEAFIRVSLPHRSGLQSRLYSRGRNGLTLYRAVC